MKILIENATPQFLCVKFYSSIRFCKQITYVNWRHWLVEFSIFRNFIE